jgi:hypothetical protein
LDVDLRLTLDPEVVTTDTILDFAVFSAPPPLAFPDFLGQSYGISQAYGIGGVFGFGAASGYALLGGLVRSLLVRLGLMAPVLSRPEWVRNAGSFVNWMRNIQRAGTRLSTQQLNFIVRQARELGLKVRLDPAHPGTPWNVPHLNIGARGQAHIPVPPGYRLPPLL